MLSLGPLLQHMPDLRPINQMYFGRYRITCSCHFRSNSHEYRSTGCAARRAIVFIHFTPEGYQTAAPKLVEALGLSLATGNQLQSEHARKLREATVAKNKLFFFRWRPANETYLRLFRKHEQGNNLKELPMFDPLIADAEGQRRQDLCGGLNEARQGGVQRSPLVPHELLLY